MIKRIGSCVVCLGGRFLSRLCVSRSHKPKNRAISELARGIELGLGGYCSLSRVDERPSETAKLLNLRDYSDLAIVLQGQIDNCLPFLVETVAYYRQAYPGANIIVSTWVTENCSSIETLKRHDDCHVVLSEPPSNRGNLNINLQMVNSLAGIRYAKSKGAKYICKTRTDQRLQRHDFLGSLIDYINEFPPAAGLPCKGRVAVLAMTYGNLFYPFLLSDFLYLGYSEDVERVFSLPLDDRPSIKMPEGSTRREWSEAELAPEVRIAKFYARSLSLSSESSVEAYWAFLRDAVVCSDIQSAGLIWPKYATRFLYEESHGLSFSNDDLEKLMTYNTDFQTWFGIYSGAIRYKRSYERLADVAFK